tara:strand:- start:435 stop:710 length:276 start_codon:yes stop_codon:yes gene_type:complete
MANEFLSEEEFHAGMAKLINYNAMMSLINEILILLVNIVHTYDTADDATITQEMRDTVDVLLSQIQRIYEAEEKLGVPCEMLGDFGDNGVH